MLRYVDEFGLFLLPFALFALFLFVTRRETLAPEPWRGARGWLAIAGLVLAITYFAAQILWLDRHTGVYVPAHMEKGVLIQGRFE